VKESTATIPQSAVLQKFSSNQQVDLPSKTPTSSTNIAGFRFDSPSSTARHAGILRENQSCEKTGAACSLIPAPYAFQLSPKSPNPARFLFPFRPIGRSLG
jgi:hypothetical protein